MSKSLTRLYVGHKNCEGVLLTPDRIGGALAQACLTLSGEFGGCSSFDAQGHYVLRGGRLITEQTTILEVAHDDGIDATLTLTSTAKYLAEALDQECVLLASTPLTTFDFVKAYSEEGYGPGDPVEAIDETRYAPDETRYAPD